MALIDRDASRRIEPGAPGVHPRRCGASAPLGPRVRRRGGLELPAALVPGQGLQGVARLELLVLARHGVGGAVPAADALGLPLLFLYVPSVERAYRSVKDIEFVVTFGSWIRAVHRISAHLMVVAVFLHLVRVFLTGAYKNGVGRGQQREWNWVIGVVMLLLTLFLSFTGYLLPGTSSPSGRSRSAPTSRRRSPGRPDGARAADRRPHHRAGDAHPLLRAARHRAAGLLGVLFAYHMWRVRKDGGLGAADRDAARRRRAATPRRRPRPTRCSAWRAARRRDGQRASRRRRPRSMPCPTSRAAPRS